MFGGTQGSWLGTLGAFDIEVSRWVEPELAIYYECDNSLTISEKLDLSLWRLVLVYQPEICICGIKL